MSSDSRSYSARARGMDIRDFYKQPAEPPPPAKRGRPSNAEKRIAAAAEAAKQQAVDEEFEAVAQRMQLEMHGRRTEQRARKHQKRPTGHVNWALPENLAVLSPCVSGWLDGTAKQEGCSLGHGAWAMHMQHGVPKGTLSQYVTSNMGTRKQLGVAPGLPAHLSDDQRQLAGGGCHPQG